MGEGLSRGKFLGITGLTAAGYVFGLDKLSKHKSEKKPEIPENNLEIFEYPKIEFSSNFFNGNIEENCLFLQDISKSILSELKILTTSTNDESLSEEVRVSNFKNILVELISKVKSNPDKKEEQKQQKEIKKIIKGTYQEAKLNNKEITDYFLNLYARKVFLRIFLENALYYRKDISLIKKEDQEGKTPLEVSFAKFLNHVDAGFFDLNTIKKILNNTSSFLEKTKDFYVLDKDEELPQYEVVFRKSYDWLINLYSSELYKKRLRNEIKKDYLSRKKANNQNLSEKDYKNINEETEKLLQKRLKSIKNCSFIISPVQNIYGNIDTPSGSNTDINFNEINFDPFQLPFGMSVYVHEMDHRSKSYKLGMSFYLAMTYFSTDFLDSIKVNENLSEKAKEHFSNYEEKSAYYVQFLATLDEAGILKYSDTENITSENKKILQELIDNIKERNWEAVPLPPFSCRFLFAYEIDIDLLLKVMDSIAINHKHQQNDYSNIS